MIFALRGDKSCENRTWVMSCIILASHCFEMLLIIISMIVVCACGKNDSSIEDYFDCLMVVGNLYIFYSLILFIIIQVFLFSEDNDCKDSTV